MESSVFGTPATVPPAEQPAQPQEPVTHESVAPEPVAPEQSQDQEENPTLAAISELRQQVEGLKQPDQPDDVDQDLLAALSAEPEEEFAPQEEYEQPQQGDPDAEAQLNQLTSFVDQRAQQMVAPLMQERREEQMQAIQQRHPDILKPEVFQPLSNLVETLAQRSGNDDLIFDPQFVEMAYKVVKAEAAESNAVPAEQAANGASLETNAGQSQTGGSSDIEDYRNQVFGQAQQRSVFG